MSGKAARIIWISRVASATSCAAARVRLRDRSIVAAARATTSETRVPMLQTADGEVPLARAPGASTVRTAHTRSATATSTSCTGAPMVPSDAASATTMRSGNGPAPVAGPVALPEISVTVTSTSGSPSRAGPRRSSMRITTTATPTNACRRASTVDGIASVS